MILPMKKVCLAVQDKHQTEALAKLREVGVVHMDASNAASDRLSEVVERKTRTEKAIGILQPYKIPKKKKNASAQFSTGKERRTDTGPRRGRRATDKLGIEELEPYSVDAVNAPARPELVNLITETGAERKALEDRMAVLARERSRIAAWGEFDPAQARELASLGYPVYLYELTAEAFANLPKEIRYIKISEDKAVTRLLVPDSEIPGITPFQLPEKSLSAIDAEIDGIQTELKDIEARLQNFADRRPVLEKELEAVQSEIEFETARAELQKAEGVPADLGFSHLSGYVPAEDMDRLKAAAAENNWALGFSDPDENDEAVPTKLKNSKLVSLLNPVTGFLGIVPGYREVDISPWFLLFFCIFFGMIFGDAGYGIILSILGLLGIIKTARKGVSQAFLLLLLLGVFNTAWGVLTCSWFGMDVENVPQILRDISLAAISPAKTDQAIVDQNLQIFCFSLALIHLTIAHLGAAVRRIKSLKVLAEIGSIGMLWGMYNVVLFLVVSPDRTLMPMQISVYILGGGFLLSFIFASYEGSIGKSILSSLKNIISVVLGVANVFSDIMSYIRLWAVGLAGASIASTVNSLAGDIAGGIALNFLVFAAIILLVFGHGLNVILNVLSVLVHGVRLNTLEFSGHIGLTWSGTAYKPFAQRVEK